MKCFCLIFSLYMLTLSCLPCNDSEHGHTGQISGATLFFSTTNSSPEHSHCGDNCSPFCGCQCCSVVCTLRFVETLEFKKPVLVEQTRVFPVSPIWLNAVSFSIDQPPEFV